VLTLDTDWAPDFVIEFAAERLIERRVRATWFVTHCSPAIEALREYRDLFELGIHPNFLPGSTHGDCPDAVLQHCMELVPEAVSMRTHALVQSTPLLEQVMEGTPITTDVSLFLPHALSLSPVEYWWRRRLLLRIPYYWEDDFEMGLPAPDWELTSRLKKADGLKVFDFHPIHIYLNSPSVNPYQRFKKQAPRLSESTKAQADSFVHLGKG